MSQLDFGCKEPKAECTRGLDLVIPIADLHAETLYLFLVNNNHANFA